MSHPESKQDAKSETDFTMVLHIAKSKGVAGRHGRILRQRPGGKQVILMHPGGYLLLRILDTIKFFVS